MRNFAKLTEKFHLTQRKFEGSSTKLHGELSSSFREIKGQNPANFASFFLYTVLYNCKKKNASFTLTLLHLLSFVHYKLSASYRGC